jgi:hypothetical protein
MALMEIDLSEIEIISLPTRRPEARLRDKYLKVYRCWQDIWLKEFGLKLETTDFTAFSELVALFYQGECVGFCFIEKKERRRGLEVQLRQISIHEKFRIENSGFNWNRFFHESVQRNMRGLGYLMIFNKRQGTETMGLKCPFKKVS